MKVPCEYCNNDEYWQLYGWVDGKPFCTRTCLMLWRETEDAKHLSQLRQKLLLKHNGKEVI